MANPADYRKGTEGIVCNDLGQYWAPDLGVLHSFKMLLLMSEKKVIFQSIGQCFA